MKIKFVLSFVLYIPLVLFGASIVGSKHDLSLSNYYGTYAGSTTEVCVFCHTPHAANEDIDGPLWNRQFTDTGVFTLYQGVAGTPNNASILCLSCHDGVSGEGDSSAVAAFETHNLINNPGSGHATNPATPNCYACHFSGGMYPGQEWRIGPNLTNDHPVSVIYPNTAQQDFLETPMNGVKLYNGMVECSSCHDVHNPANGTFLRVSNVNSALCNSCHVK
ncbi:MAG: hypothetical protein QG560_356 [Campylobacterota bacterium]|nr:hypothetical protein [Campylobacterota bacterium]MDQ1338336.1 hypothetical protein [Campylobacterota bacterium]